MKFANLFAIKRFLETANVSKLWGFRLQGRYTVFVGNDMLELNLSISGRNIAEYTQRQLRQNNPTQKVQYDIVSVTKSEMNAQGYEGLVRYLDELILSINFEQVG